MGAPRSAGWEPWNPRWDAAWSCRAVGGMAQWPCTACARLTEQMPRSDKTSGMPQSWQLAHTACNEPLCPCLHRLVWLQFSVVPCAAGAGVAEQSSRDGNRHPSHGAHQRRAGAACFWLSGNSLVCMQCLKLPLTCCSPCTASFPSVSSKSHAGTGYSSTSSSSSTIMGHAPRHALLTGSRLGGDQPAGLC